MGDAEGDDAPHEVAVTVPSHRRALAIGLVLAVTAFAFDNLAISAAMPVITEDLGGVSLYGAAFSAFGLATVFSLAVTGPLADRRGPRPVLAAGLVAFTAGLVVGGLAPTMPVVVAARAVQGFGGGTIGACAYVAIGRAWAPDERARMFAFMSAAWIVPGLVAPGLAGVVADHLTWRLVFLGLIPFPLLAAALALPPLRAIGPVTGAGHDEPIGSRLVSAALVTVGTALVLGGFQTDNAVTALPLVVVGAVVAVPGLRRILPPGTIRAAPVLPALVAVRAMLNWAFFGADAFIPFVVTEVRGHSAFAAGLVLTASSIAWSAAAWVQAKPGGPGLRRAVTLGFGLIASGSIAVIALSLDPDLPLWMVFAAWAIAASGMGFAFNATSVAALAEAAPGEEGATSSSLQLADALGAALATGLGGTIVAVGDRSGWPTGDTAAWVLVLTVAAVVPGLLAVRRLPHSDASTLTRSAA